MHQKQIFIYCFPGQGSDKRIFENLKIDAPYRIRVLEYDAPDRGESLADFSKKFIALINTKEKFILLGHSLGGMICAELNEILQAEKTIIISGAKNRKQFPFQYRFQKYLPLYQLFPGTVLLWGAKILQPLVEPDRNTHRDVFKSMLAAKSSVYMKRTIHMLLTWSRTENSKPVIQIHGDQDRTIPLKNIRSADFIVKGGSHMMVLTRANEISGILNWILKQVL